jgi:hypothetical protein
MDVAPLDMPVIGDLTATARALLAASGAEWRFSVEGPWALATPVGARSPEQGWKLHVSATGALAYEADQWWQADAGLVRSSVNDTELVAYKN